MGARNDKKAILAATLVVALLVIATYAYYAFSAHTGYSLGSFKRANLTIALDNSTVNGSVYLALNLSQWTQGYQDEKSFGSCGGSGMQCLGVLFVFPNESDECFWMLNTEFPMDQIWIGSNFTVTYTHIGTPYSTNSFCGYGQYVLETLPNYTINAGDRVIPHLPDNIT